MLRLLVASGCLFAAAGAFAEPLRLSSTSLEETLSGSLLEFDTPIGTTIRVRFSKDGLVSGKAGALASVLGAERDRGRWWVDSDQLCVKWFRWFEAEKRCVVVHQEGDRLFWRGNERNGTAVIVERPKTTEIAAEASKASTLAKSEPTEPKVEQVANAPAAPLAANKKTEEPGRMTFATAGAAGTSPFNLIPAAVAAPELPAQAPSVTPARSSLDTSAASVAAATPSATKPGALAKPARPPRKAASKPAPTAASSLVMRTSFRVAGVDEHDMLNVRSGPSELAAQVGALPPEERGVRIIGPCREAWCPIEHGRMKGWVNRYYLAVEETGANAAP